MFQLPLALALGGGRRRPARLADRAECISVPPRLPWDGSGWAGGVTLSCWSCLFSFHNISIKQHFLEVYQISNPVLDDMENTTDTKEVKVKLLSPNVQFSDKQLTLDMGMTIAQLKDLIKTLKSEDLSVSQSFINHYGQLCSACRIISGHQAAVRRENTE